MRVPQNPIFVYASNEKDVENGQNAFTCDEVMYDEIMMYFDN